jgi:hypothetical protein
VVYIGRIGKRVCARDLMAGTSFADARMKARATMTKVLVCAPDCYDKDNMT